MRYEKLLKAGLQIVGLLLLVIIMIFYSWKFIYKPNVELAQVDEEFYETIDSRLQVDEKFTKEKNLPEIKWKDVSIMLGGDVMMSRYVGRKMAQENNYSLAWDHIQGKLKRADLALINLEAPFIETDDYFVNDDQMNFKVNPQCIEGLIKSGIDGVSLANNHIYNQGPEGLEYTEKLLSSNLINYSLDKPTFMKVTREKITYKVAMLAYSYDLGLDVEDLKEEIARIKEKDPDYIIVSLHAGNEYATEPSQQQIDFAHLAIDEGANLVWGHHPHVVQSKEEYQGGYIYYSLGNLIFDQGWSEPTTEGLVIELIFEPGDSLELKEIKEHPIKIEENFQPTWVMNDEKQ